MRPTLITLDRLALFPAAAVALLALACGGGGDHADSAQKAGDTIPMAMAPSTPRVWVASPADGDTVPAAGFDVQVSVEGVRLVPAAPNRVEGEGHLHFFIDREVTRLDMPIPIDSATIVHMGNAASSYTFRNLSPGPHRLILVYAYGDHTPDVKVATDTLNIVVK
jgi:hypothetical protein